MPLSVRSLIVIAIAALLLTSCAAPTRVPVRGPGSIRTLPAGVTLPALGKVPPPAPPIARPWAVRDGTTDHERSIEAPAAPESLRVGMTFAPLPDVVAPRRR